MIQVKVRLYATLSGYNPAGQGNSPFTVEVPQGTSVAELLNKLEVPGEEVKQIFIRYKARTRDFTLEDGDQIALFPAVAGG